MSRVNVRSENKQGPVPAVVSGNDKPKQQGVIVLQEWWGLNDQIQDEAKLLGEQGNFMTITPDLYRGKVAKDNEEAGHLMSGLDWTGAIQDIQGCAKYLKEQGCKKVGVTGFCMGGALALATAVKVPEVSAAAPFYGIPGGDFDVSTIKIPVQCHFGDQDDVAGFSDPKSQTALQDKLKSGKVKFEFHSYPGCKHAFTNSTGPNFNKAAFELSFKRLTEFFQKNL